MAKITVTVTVVALSARPGTPYNSLEDEHVAYVVKIEVGPAMWREEFTDHSQAKMFIRGVRALARVAGDDVSKPAEWY